MTNNILFNIHKLSFVFMGIVALFQYGCGKDDHAPVENTFINVPSALQVNAASDKATISGEADTGSEVTFQYEGTHGQVLRKIKADASGHFSFSIDLLVDYEQQLIAFASKDDQTSETVKVDKIPSKAAFADGWENARQLMQAHRWKSDQTVSRVIIKQSAATPPYDMFATVAQKYFTFKSDGSFVFEVSSPVQFTDENGTWKMDENGVADIQTTIPLGPMEIKMAKIQELDNDRLTLLAEISDGLFLLSFTKE